MTSNLVVDKPPDPDALVTNEVGLQVVLEVEVMPKGHWNNHWTLPCQSWCVPTNTSPAPFDNRFSKASANSPSWWRVQQKYLHLMPNFMHLPAHLVILGTFYKMLFLHASNIQIIMHIYPYNLCYSGFTLHSIHMIFCGLLLTQILELQCAKYAKMSHSVFGGSIIRSVITIERKEL